MAHRRPRLLALALAASVAAAACATVPTGPLKDGEVRVQRLVVPGPVSPGAYCSTPREDAASKTVSVGLFTRNPNTYTLLGILKYTHNGQSRESNPVAATLVVR